MGLEAATSKTVDSSDQSEDDSLDEISVGQRPPLLSPDPDILVRNSLTSRQYEIPILLKYVIASLNTTALDLSSVFLSLSHVQYKAISSYLGGGRVSKLSLDRMQKLVNVAENEEPCGNLPDFVLEPRV